MGFRGTELARRLTSLFECDDVSTIIPNKLWCLGTSTLGIGAYSRRTIYFAKTIWNAPDVLAALLDGEKAFVRIVGSTRPWPISPALQERTSFLKDVVRRSESGEWSLMEETMDTKILSTKSTKKVTHSSRNDKVRKLEEELTRQFNEMKRLTRAGKIKERDKLIKKIHVTN